jgi:hypothetical protein
VKTLVQECCEKSVLFFFFKFLLYVPAYGFHWFLTLKDFLIIWLSIILALSVPGEVIPEMRHAHYI